MVDPTTPHSHDRSPVQMWRDRLAAMGLEGLAHSMASALRPLAPVVAQLVWLAQPTIALFGRAQLANDLAEWLDARQLNDPATPSKNG